MALDIGGAGVARGVGGDGDAVGAGVAGGILLPMDGSAGAWGSGISGPGYGGTVGADWADVVGTDGDGSGDVEGDDGVGSGVVEGAGGDGDGLDADAAIEPGDEGVVVPEDGGAVVPADAGGAVAVAAGALCDVSVDADEPVLPGVAGAVVIVNAVAGSAVKRRITSMI